MELFESIPDVVKIEEVNGDVRQTDRFDQEGLKVLSEQTLKLSVKIPTWKDRGDQFSDFGYILLRSVRDDNSTVVRI